MNDNRGNALRKKKSQSSCNNWRDDASKKVIDRTTFRGRKGQSSCHNWRKDESKKNYSDDSIENKHLGNIQYHWKNGQPGDSQNSLVDQSVKQFHGVSHDFQSYGELCNFQRGSRLNLPHSNFRKEHYGSQSDYEDHAAYKGHDNSQYYEKPKNRFSFIHDSGNQLIKKRSENSEGISMEKRLSDSCSDSEHGFNNKNFFSHSHVRERYSDYSIDPNMTCNQSSITYPYHSKNLPYLRHSTSRGKRKVLTSNCNELQKNQHMESMYKNDPGEFGDCDYNGKEGNIVCKKQNNFVHQSNINELDTTDILNNFSLQNTKDKIALLRALNAASSKLMKTMKPADIITNCREEIVRCTEECLTRHQNMIMSFVKSDLEVLMNHAQNLKQQNKNFEQFVQNMRLKLLDIQCDSVDSVINETNEILRMVKLECMRFKKSFPAYALINNVKSKISSDQVLIITLDAVYYANIVLPIYLQGMFKSSTISVCEPKEALAINLAKNCSVLTQQPLGSLVGFDVGKSHKKDVKTKILYTTVQHLLSVKKNDPMFSEFSIMVFDEFMRRSVEDDLLLDSVRKCLKVRDDFKVILLVCNAKTAEKYSKYFSNVSKVSLMDTPNLILPVTTIWKERVSTSHDDYVMEVVNICLAIHAMKESGDILAFLPNDQDTIKASVLLKKKFQEYSYNDASCIVINEKTENKKILDIIDWEKSPKRNVIFVTSGYEIITFPTVVYVVDCGRVEGLIFDSTKNVEVIATSFVSKCTAKVRKNCAGRSRSGICYRLYNKENFIKGMSFEELPEFLTANPFNCYIKLFQYNPNDALSIEPVDPLPDHIKERALQSLKHYGCIKNNHLTVLGEHIVKLPFSAKYSKLIVLGINRGFSFEVIILVAFFMVKGSVFLDKNVHAHEKEIDAATLKFIQHNSDTLMYLNIYQQWMKNDFEKSWCLKNHLNANYLRQIDLKVTKIVNIVNKNLKENIAKVMSEYEDLNIIQEIILESFQSNLCVYTGHSFSGYQLVNANCIVFPHPSSALHRREVLPQFVVYDNLCISTQKYMLHVTSVPESMVLEMIKNGNGNEKISHNTLFEKRLVPVVIDKVGVMIIKRTLGDAGKKIKELEEHIQNEIQTDLIIIEPSIEKATVTIYAPPDYVLQAEKILRNVLEKNFELLHSEEETLILELNNGGASVRVNITWAKGAEISALEMNTNEVNVVKLSANSLKGDISCVELPATEFSVKLTWLRRPCKGYGFVSFESQESFRRALKLVMKNLPIKDNLSEVQRSKNSPLELFISDIPSDALDEDLRDAFQNALGEDIQISTCYVVRTPSFKTSESDINSISDLLFQKCKELLKAANVDVVVPKPDDSAEFMIAFIIIQNQNAMEIVANSFNADLKIENFKVEATPIYSTTLFCSPEIFKSVELSVYEVLKSLEKHLQTTCGIPPDEELFRFESDAYDVCTVRLKLYAYNKRVMSIFRRTVYELIKGKAITEHDLKGLHRLFSHGGHIWLRRLEKSANLYILDEYKSKTIRLYGSQKVCDIAVRRIQEFLNDEDESVKTINLSNGTNPSVILKAVIQEYGVNLEKFVEVHQLRSAELDIRSCNLTLHGSRESVEKAENKLEALAEKLDSRILQGIHDQQEYCPVCSWPAITLTYRLETCGHLYCVSCIKGLVLEPKFPIRCCAEDCDELVLEDVRKLLDYEKNKIDNLLKLSLKDYISHNTEKYSYCPFPDCAMFFDKTSVNGICWNCPLCHNDICIQCNTIYHHGYSCDIYQGMKKDSDYSFKVWLREGNRDCKFCPNCSTAIEKNDGCNHMTCQNCHTHFCWLCIKAFPTSNQVYEHMPYCTRNQTP